MQIEPAWSGVLGGVLVALLVAGCGVREAPHTAEAEGAAHAARLADADVPLVDVRAATAYDVAVAQAEGAHSVAVERCDALVGDGRRSCRERADADLELAKSRARQVRDSRS